MPPCEPDFPLLKHSQAKYWIPGSSTGSILYLTLTFDLTVEKQKTFSTEILKNHGNFTKTIISYR